MSFVRRSSAFTGSSIRTPHVGAAVVAALAAPAVSAPPNFELAWSTTFPTVHGPTRFAFADLDGDKVLDAVFPGRDAAGLVYVYRGNGDGSFVDPISFDVDSQTDWAEFDDVDGDGVLDIVLAGRASAGSVIVMHGRGGFDFDPPVSTPAGREPRGVALGDVGTNGQRELRAVLYGESAVRSFAADERGDYAVVDRQECVPWSAGGVLPQWIGAADADDDGRRDSWVISSGAGAVTIIDGEESADLGVSRTWRVPLHRGQSPGVSLGDIVDLDGDGDLDLAAAGLCISPASQALVVFRNDGDGNLNDSTTHVVTSVNTLAWGIATGDLDGDDDLDAVVTTALPGKLFVLEQDSSGAFATVQEFTLGSFVRHALAADLDGDCKPEIVAVDLATNTMFVFRNVTEGFAGCGSPNAPNAAARGAAAPTSAAAPASAPARVASEALAARVAAARPAGPEAVMQVLANFGAPLEGAPARPARTDGAGSLLDDGALAEAGGQEGGVAATYPECGPVSGGSCAQAHDGVGCYIESCCIMVCDLDLSCCEEAWDAECAQQARLICEEVTCPGPGSCFEPHPTRGCDDEECCMRYRRLDPFCDSSRWDELCVTGAQRFCTIAACTLPDPAPTSIDEAEFCYQRFNQGCAGGSPESANWIEIECGAQLHGTSTTGSPRDTDWFRFELLETTTVRFEAASEFPARLLLIEGPCAGPLRLLAEASGYDCTPFALEQSLEPGVYQIVLGVGMAERVIMSGQPCPIVDPKTPWLPKPTPGFFGIRWQASFTCEGAGLLGDINGDGMVDGSDLVIVLGHWGPCADCIADLNGDDVVDGADLAIVLGHWTG